MANPTIDKEFRKSLNEAKLMIDAVIKADANEAETGRRIERMFDMLMGYDIFKNVTREHAVHSVGNSDYCDLAIQLDDTKTPVMLIEIKRATTELASKHLKQTASYAINVGCEWAILTNGKTWQLYHIAFTQPPQTMLIESWDLMNDEPHHVAEKFGIVSYKNVKRGGLKQLWDKRNVLTAANVLKSILSEESISMIRRGLKKATDVNVTPEEVVGAVRRLLNEAAVGEMAKIKISLPEKKPAQKKTSPPALIIATTPIPEADKV